MGEVIHLFSNHRKQPILSIVPELQKILTRVRPERLELLNEMKLKLSDFDANKNRQGAMRYIMAKWSPDEFIEYINNAEETDIRQQPLNYVMALQQLIQTDN